MLKKVIILGAGCAGLTAGIYTARANLAPLILAGNKPGGQLTLTTLVENFPGFVDGIMGPDLILAMQKQCERFGGTILNEDVESVDFTQKNFRVTTRQETFESQSIIIATGSGSIWLGLESEQRLIGRGVSNCATCDGYFFTNKEVAIIGGGDSAMEEALFLTKFANKVTVIHRRDQLRASKIMQNRAFNNPKIVFKLDSCVEEILGSDCVTGLKIKNIKTLEIQEIPVNGVFITIGHKPHTEIFKDQIDLDPKGYIIVSNQTRTNIPGVFVAGDVADHTYRQAITAAGMGCKAAMDVEKYLSSLV